MRLRFYPAGRREMADVVLSERNLLALLHKLHMTGSAHTLIGADCPEGYELVVRVESDDVHYRQRSKVPGRLHSATEAFIATQQGQDLPSPDLDPDEVPLPEGIQRSQRLVEILRQAKVWFDRAGRFHQVEYMSLEYLLNVIGFLERQVPWFHTLELAREERFRDSGLDLEEFEEYDLAVDPDWPSMPLKKWLELEWHASDFTDPIEWLHASPLFQALQRAANAHLARQPEESGGEPPAAGEGTKS